MPIEVTKEPPPPPKPGARMTGGCHIHIVEEKTGKVVNEVKTPYYFVNEKRLREEPKY